MVADFVTYLHFVFPDVAVISLARNLLNCEVKNREKANINQKLITNKQI